MLLLFGIYVCIYVVEVGVDVVLVEFDYIVL